MTMTAAPVTKRKATRKRLIPNGPTFPMVKVDNRWHIYENAAVPANVPIYRAVCEICHNASAYLMLRYPPTVECMSCKEDRIALDALRVQDECGVNLGWKTPGLTERRDYLGRLDMRGMQGQRCR